MSLTKHQYLRAMGIDVWIPRDAVGASSPDTAAAVMSPTSPAVDLYLVAYPGVGVVFENPGDDDLPRCKRLTDDLALALLGKTSAGKPGRLKWPEDGDAEVPDPEAAAREAVRNRVAKLGPRIIACGSSAGRFLDGGNPASHGNQAILAAPDLMELMENPLKKRDLWRALAGFRE